MRENIGLFKAKRKDNGEWVEGYFAIEPNFYPVTGVNNYTIRSYTFLESGEIVWTGIYKVDPNTVSQCTGLEDKNGKLIFENDILRAYGSYNLIVVWDKENAMFYAEYKGIKSGHEDDDNDDFADACDFDSYEVIGNIFNGGNCDS